MQLLTIGEHRLVVERLINLAKIDGVNMHSDDFAYTSLMVCFLMHSRASAESLIALHARFGDEWFPATTGYVIVRSLFEVDVTAHYISRDPVKRSSAYIEYEHILNKRMMDAVVRHKASSNASWKEGMTMTYDQEYAQRKAKIDAEYARVRGQFENAKGRPFRSWSGKTIREMAQEVNHTEAYDVFYDDLSSFTHVSVNLANRFLRVQPDKIGWSQRADEYDVGNVFRYAATFLTCLLEHFGEQFGTWTAHEARACWNIPTAATRRPRLS
jgi:hypothetical protein